MVPKVIISQHFGDKSSSNDIIVTASTMAVAYLEQLLVLDLLLQVVGVLPSLFRLPLPQRAGQLHVLLPTLCHPPGLRRSLLGFPGALHLRRLELLAAPRQGVLHRVAPRSKIQVLPAMVRSYG